MKALVFRLSALGDVIHTIPAVVALREIAEVSWVVEAAYAELVEVVAGVSAIPVRMKRWGRSPFALRGEMSAARRAMRGFDVAIDFQGLMKSAALARLSGAPLRFGFDRDAVRERPALWFTNRHVPVDRSQHVIDWNRQMAAAVVGATGVIPSRARDEANWDAFAGDREGKLAPLTQRIVLLPGAGKAEKRWPVSRFREIVARFPGRTLAVWGPGERELAGAIGGEVAPPTSLRELAFLLKHAKVVVGGDTGPLHLAAAVGPRVVGIYGPTDPVRNGPYGQIASSVSHYHSTGSVESVTADEVILKIREVLGERL
ncbi:MAG: lipopolysaccharide heptosyltransferase I [Thermoanaerobaculia bacterium]|nr:lipopolysaccharide heptosyltransferase I [Thermoanaerobaculia bacterium]